ncbi:MAG: cell wall-binding repeat-containing protein [Gracilibacteraceae bacterium]|nr:cell wall-binding repeat-containing protein [Gracilibacteraceae bacterium]
MKSIGRKRVLASVLAVLMLFSVLPAAIVFADPYEGGKYYDGVYSGTGLGHISHDVGVPLSLDVTIESDVITGIYVTDRVGQTDSYWNTVDPALLNRIIAEQSAEVDAISGATQSSNGILDAVEAALRKANALPLIETGTHEDVDAAIWHISQDRDSMMATLLAPKADLEITADGKAYAYLKFVPTVIANVAINGDAVKSVTSRINGTTYEETATLVSSAPEETVFRVRVYNVLEPTFIDVFHTGMSEEGGTNEVRLKLQLAGLIPDMDVGGEIIAPGDGDFDGDGVPNLRDYYPRNPQKNFDAALQTVKGNSIPVQPARTLAAPAVTQQDLDGLKWNTNVRLQTDAFSVRVPTALVDAALARYPEAGLNFRIDEADGETLAAMETAAAALSVGNAVKGFTIGIDRVAAEEGDAGGPLVSLGGEFMLTAALTEAETDALKDFHYNAIYYYDRDRGALEQVDAFFILDSRQFSVFAGRAGMYLITTRPVDGLPELNWVETFGGAGGENFTLISETSDGGFVVYGTATSTDGDMAGQPPGGSKPTVIKYDAAARIEWVFSTETRWTALDLKESESGGYLVAGRTNIATGMFAGLNKGGMDAFVLKLSADGELEWLKNFGSTRTDEFNSLILENGGFIAFGSFGATDGDMAQLQSNGDIDGFYVEFDADGVVVSMGAWGGDKADTVAKAVSAEEGGYLIAGTSGSGGSDFNGLGHGGNDAYLLKLSDGGAVEWVKTFGGTAADTAVSLTPLGGGEYLLGMYYRSIDGMFYGKNMGGQSIGLIKVNSSGERLWMSGLSDQSTDMLLDVERDADGGVVVLFRSTVSSVAAPVNCDYADLFYEPEWRNGGTALARLDAASGKILYKALYRGSNANDQLADFLTTDDGGILAVGRNTYNAAAPGIFSGLNHSAAASSLDGAIVKFGGEPAKTERGALGALNEAAALLDEAGRDEADWTTFTAVRTKAEAALANAYATQKGIDAAYDELAAAFELLGEQPPLYTAALTAKIAEAKVIQADDYTSESYQALQTAIAAAEAVLANAETTQAEVNDQVTALKAAVAALANLPADTAALTAKLAEAKAIQADDYTSESYQALQTAIAAAEAVLANGGATQAEVDDQVTALAAAVSALETKPAEPTGIAALEAALTAAREATGADSETNSQAALTAAISAAEAALALQGLTPAQADKQTAALKAALEALIAEDALQPRSDAVPAGEYSFAGRTNVRSYSDPSNNSMADGAVSHADSQIVTDVNGNMELLLTMKPLTIGSLEGYLETLARTGENGKTTPATVHTWYAADELGGPYPRTLSIPVTIGEAEIVIEVFVPIMDAITPGAGTQPARLRLNWEGFTLPDGSEETADTGGLEAAVTAVGELNADDFSPESFAALAASVAAGEYLIESNAALTVSQDMVNKRTAAILAAIEALLPADVPPAPPASPVETPTSAPIAVTPDDIIMGDNGAPAAAVTADEGFITGAVQEAMDNNTTTLEISVTLPAENQPGGPAEVGAVYVALPPAALEILLEELANEDSSLANITIASPVGSISFDLAALGSLSKQAGADRAVNVVVERAALEDLPSSLPATARDAQAYDLRVYYVGGDTDIVPIQNFGGSRLRISLPYALPNDKDPGDVNVRVWYVDGTDSESMDDAAYIPDDRRVTFSTTHLSYYAVGYEETVITPNPPAGKPSPNGGSGLAVVAGPEAAAPITVSKASLSYISGADRVQTSVAISRQGWTSAETVILAPGGQNNLIDALAVAPLAGQEKAPILLSTGSLDPAVVAEIQRLGAKKVYAVGAVSQTAIEALEALPGLTVETLRGASRFETAELVGAKLTAPKGTFIVGYNAIADAVSAASFAAANGYAIQIASPDGWLARPLPVADAGSATIGSIRESGAQPDSAKGRASDDHDTTRVNPEFSDLPVYILGGPTLLRDVPGATRLYGATRYETNKAVRDALNIEYTNIYTADGNTLVDALTGSALAAQTKAAIVLLPGNDPAGADFGAITPETKLYAFGG